jgi:hypothetical protein
VTSVCTTNIQPVVPTCRITTGLKRLHTYFLESDQGKVIDYAGFGWFKAINSFSFKVEANDWWTFNGFKQYILWKSR